LIVSVKSTVDAGDAEAAGFGCPFVGNFCAAAAMEVAVCLPFPFVSGGFDAARFAFEVMTKRRRTGTVLAAAFGATGLLRLRDALFGADDFLFNINIRPK
jgi:hypothetical protein